MPLSAAARNGRKKETRFIRARIKAPVQHRKPGERPVHSLCIAMMCALLLVTACKPVSQDSLTLLYTSDTTGQIEPCG